MRPYIKLDIAFFRHPKIVIRSKDARELHIRGIMYCAEYLTDGFIPREAVNEMTSVDSSAVGELTGGSKPLWHVVDGGFMIHDYLDWQTSKSDVESKRSTRKEAGRKGGKAKAGKQTSSKTSSKSQANDQANDVANDQQNSGKSLAILEVRSKKEDPDQNPDLSSHSKKNAQSRATVFDQFWEAYPKKVGKLKARKAWDQAKGKPPIEVMVAALEKQKATENWKEQDGRFIPNPARWLNEGRWLDEVGAVKKQPKPKLFL